LVTQHQSREMRVIRTLFCLLACIAVQQIVSFTISEEEKDNLKIYKDYWEAFYYREQPNMILLGEIRNASESFDTKTKNMKAFTNPIVKSETARIQSFPKKLLQDVIGMTETSDDNIVTWKKTSAALSSRRALNAQLHEQNRELSRRFMNWRTDNKPVTIPEEDKVGFKIYKDYWRDFYSKASKFINSRSPNMTLLGEIRNASESFDTKTIAMAQFTNPTVNRETRWIKSFPKKLLEDVAGLTETTATDGVIWKRTSAAMNNRRALNSQLHEENSELATRFSNW
ncbi:hypothetical protein CRM22_001284, partial [Opisthorchis felineus]